MNSASTGHDGATLDALAQLETPILFLIFNRPEMTRDVFETIRAARPRRLYLAADGPRLDVVGETERCADARRVVNVIDWPCQLQTRFQDMNMGLAMHVSSALDWFFSHEEEGIVLEDDCVPHPSFFRFCAELLERYRDTPSVMHISGDNFQYGRRRGRASYYFSRYAFVWGWASWARAWNLYDFADAPPDVRATAWSTQWLRALEKNNGAAIVPNINLVTNVGFGADATHTKKIEKFAMLPARRMEFPLIHPPRIEIDRVADRFTYFGHYRNVRYVRLIWIYEFVDMVVRMLKSVKRVLRKTLCP